MSKETMPKDEQGEGEGGLPIQAILMLATLGLAMLAIVLKMLGIF